jgi:transcriptional regulator GlxA family with amidase domain
MFSNDYGHFVPSRPPEQRVPRTIMLVATDGVQMLDLAGPMDVFAEANRQLGRDGYQLRVVAAASGPLRSSSGLRIVPDAVAGPRYDGRADTVLVAGSPHAADQVFGRPLLDWLVRTSRGARRYGSVCTGAFMLAEAGLADGRTVATHWSVASELARRYPNVTVDADAFHVRDGRVRTAAGITAGLDLALALVEEDLGQAVAKAVAAELVMLFRRPGGQRQFSREGAVGPAGRSALQDLQRYVAANPAEDHSIASMAARLSMSRRHFARVFRAELDITPAAWVEACRVGAARAMLEDARGGVPKQVAARCGFRDGEMLRRAFKRQLGVTPAEYRRGFNAPR